MSRLVATIALGALAGCTLAPSYERSKYPVDARCPGGTGAGLAAAGRGWRGVFGDPRLQAIIALRNNRDLRVAMLDVELTQAQYRIQRSELVPTWRISTRRSAAAGARADSYTRLSSAPRDAAFFRSWVFRVRCVCVLASSPPMRPSPIFLVLVGISACGDGGVQVGVDAPSVATTLTISGNAGGIVALTRTTTETGSVAGARIEFFKNADEVTAIASATADEFGGFSLSVPTAGVPLDGYLKAAKADYLDTYFYPPAPLSSDLSLPTIILYTPDASSFLRDVACNVVSDVRVGAIHVVVRDAIGDFVDQAMVTASPSPGTTCYNDSNGQPAQSASSTWFDGVGYMLNANDQVSVTASKDGLVFKSHTVKARANAWTMTQVTP